MKGNTEKFHFLMSTNESFDFQLGGSLIERSDCEKMLGVKISYKVNFDELVKTLCSKANNKLKSSASNSICESGKKRKY